MKSDLSSTISVIEKSSKKVRFNESADNRLNDTSSPKSLKPKRKYGMIFDVKFFQYRRPRTSTAFKANFSHEKLKIVQPLTGNFNKTNTLWHNKSNLLSKPPLNDRRKTFALTDASTEDMTKLTKCMVTKCCYFNFINYFYHSHQKEGLTGYET